MPEQPYMHEHSHPHTDSSSVGPFSGSPRTMFYLGLFVGIAAYTTLTLLLLLSFIMSGKSLPAIPGADTGAVAAAPTPSAAQPSAAAPTAAAASPVKAVDEKADHILGPKNAKVTLIEYSDFECPFCKRHFDTINQIVQKYPKDVRVVFRHFPLSFHQNAQKEAEASECVTELGGNDAFWKFHDKIFTETTSNGTGIALTRLAPIAKEIGLDDKKFQTCLDSGKYAAKIAQQEQEGSDAGVQGTPGTFVNGKLVEGAVPLAQFVTMIDGILKK